MPPEHSPVPSVKTNSGPVIAIIIILGLLVFGALYFLQQHLSETAQKRNEIPYIPSGTTTIIIRE